MRWILFIFIVPLLLGIDSNFSSHSFDDSMIVKVDSCLDNLSTDRMVHDLESRILIKVSEGLSKLSVRNNSFVINVSQKVFVSNISADLGIESVYIYKNMIVARLFSTGNDSCVVMFQVGDLQVNKSFDRELQVVRHLENNTDIKVIIDPSNQVLEIDETNNEYHGVYYDMKLPDIFAAFSNKTHIGVESDSNVGNVTVILLNEDRILTQIVDLKAQEILYLKFSGELHVILDPENLILESDEENNYYGRSSDFSIDVHSFVGYQQLFNSYLSRYFSLGGGIAVYLQYSPELRFKGQKLSLPHLAVIENNGSITVKAMTLSGIISGLQMLRDPKVFIPGEYLVDSEKSLALYDYLKLQSYERVENALFGKFDSKIVYVKSKSGTILRLNHISAGLSQSFKDEFDRNSPVVLAGGLWSDISAWEKLGDELSSLGYDVWLAEITGGPYAECATCPNYSYDELVDDFLPSLVGSVIAITGSKVNYIGHSNGARTALDMLSRYQETGVSAGSYYDGVWKDVSLPADPIETMIAVGVPGAFEGWNPVAGALKITKDAIRNNLYNKTQTHISIKDLFLSGLLNMNYFSRNMESRISIDLLEQYSYWISVVNDSQPGNNLSSRNFAVIQGNALVTTDGIVSVADEKEIYENILLKDSIGVFESRKYRFNVFTIHTSMINNIEIAGLIKSILNNDITDKQKYRNLLSISSRSII